MWRNLPWLLALVLAPLLFGSVTVEGQVVIAGLLATSVLLLAGEIGGQPWKSKLLFAAAVLVVLLPLVPLPISLVESMSPRHAALARTFSVDAGNPQWVSLALSPAGAMQRLWEIALIVTTFCLARHSARRAGFALHLAVAVGMGLACLAAADIWYRWDGRRSILGLWNISWGWGAGTFANRNHFANWVYVGGLFVAGVVLREWLPFRSARQGEWTSSRFQAVFVLLALTFALGMAVACASRGGIVAFTPGVLVWVALLLRHSRRRQRSLWAGLALVGLLLLVAMLGELLFQRFGEINPQWAARYPKFTLWRDTVELWLRFPLFGVGWGGFVHAFSVFKTFGGDMTFLHAENDWLQLLVENGVLGAGVLLACLSRLLVSPVRQVWRGRMAEPELTFGAWAGLVAFATNACFDFVFQIPANALLAAALFGFLVGSAGQENVTAVPPLPSRGRVALNCAWALALFFAATLQGVAFWHWHAGMHTRDETPARSSIEKSLRAWPWASKRALELTRIKANSLATAGKSERGLLLAEIHGHLTAALGRDPLNWELRLIRAWLAASYIDDRGQMRAAVLTALKANPLQVQVPLQLARILASRDADFAQELLRLAPNQTPDDLRLTLDLAWRLSRDTGELWRLTPDTVPGLETLVKFALEQKLFGLAAEACTRLAGRVGAVKLADYYLRARLPEEALRILPERTDDLSVTLTRARAYHEAGKHLEAIRTAQAVWLASPAATSLLAAVQGGTSLILAREEWEAQPNNPLRARRLAEIIFQQPVEQRDLVLLRRLAAGFPSNLRLLWLVWQTEMDLGQVREASATSLQLAEKASQRK